MRGVVLGARLVCAVRIRKNRSEECISDKESTKLPAQRSRVPSAFTQTRRIFFLRPGGYIGAQREASANAF